MADGRRWNCKSEEVLSFKLLENKKAPYAHLHKELFFGFVGKVFGYA